MSISVYGKDSTINGNINISGELQIKDKTFNTVSTPSLGTQYTDSATSLKYYNVTLVNTLAETTVLDTESIMDSFYNEWPVTVNVTLPQISSSTLGMTFNFIKTNILSFVVFKTADTNSNTIITQGTNESKSVTLLKFEITSVQLIAISNKWLVMNSFLPQQISNPVGSIITMPASNLPLGYFLCNGAQYTRSHYPELFAVIGYTYGGNSSTLFQVPNFQNGSFLRGYNVNVTASLGTQQSDNIKTHTHSSTFYRIQRGSNDGVRAIGLDNLTGAGYNEDPKTVTSISNYNTSGSNPNETRPINYAVYYYIKY